MAKCPKCGNQLTKTEEYLICNQCCIKYTNRSSNNGIDTPHKTWKQNQKPKFEIKHPKKRTDMSALMINLISLGVGFIVGLIAWLINKDAVISFSFFGGVAAFLLYIGLFGLFRTIASILLYGWIICFSVGSVVSSFVLMIPIVGLFGWIAVWLFVLYACAIWFALFFMGILIAGLATIVVLVISTIILLIAQAFKFEVNPGTYHIVQIIVLILTAIFLGIMLFLDIRT